MSDNDFVLDDRLTFTRKGRQVVTRLAPTVDATLFKVDAEPLPPSGRGLTPNEVARIVRDLDTQEQIDMFLETVELADDEVLFALLTAEPTEEALAELIATTATAGMFLAALALTGTYALMRLGVPSNWQNTPLFERRQRATAAIASADRTTIDGEALAQYRNDIDQHYRTVTQGHGQSLADGSIDLAEYHRRMVETISEAHTVQRRLGQGNLSPQAERELRSILDEQLGYLGDMVGQIERGEVSGAQVIDRSGRYGANGGLSFNMGMAAATAIAAATEQRFLGACTPHCQECVDYAARGRVAVGSLPVPRVACSCRDRCCCTLRRYDLSDRLVGVIG